MDETCVTWVNNKPCGKPVVNVRVLFGKEFPECAGCNAAVERSLANQRKSWSRSAAGHARAQGEYFRR